jgi:molecular chaperone DnaK (HSP70)
MAGLNVRRLLEEPTAAAVAYGTSIKNQEGEKTILVFDLGGGSFDVSLLNFEDGIFQVLAVNGHTSLGGEDFTNRLINYCLEQILEKHKLKITEERSK